jgi:penicillin-binding protein 1A
METPKRASAHPRRSWLAGLERGLVALALFVLAGGLVGVGVLFYVRASLPDIRGLADYHPPQVSRLVDTKGRVVAELYEEKRTLVALARVPLHVRHAFLAAEDADFYTHPGMDWTGMARAMLKNLLQGRLAQGGSTITQQVAKNLVVGPERTLWRKVRELLVALRLESFLGKDDILALYLNEIYFGHRCYGIQEASRFYFDKDVAELGAGEAALLAALPKSPTNYSPLKHPERARGRRDWVLSQMVAHQWLTSEAAAAAQAAPLAVVGHAPDFFELAPYYAEHCRRMLEERLGRERLYQGAYRVELALDLDQQQLAQAVLARGLREVDRRHGWRGPLGRVEPAHLDTLRAKLRAELDLGRIWTLVRPEGASQAPPERRWRARAVEPTPGAWLQVPVVALEGEGPAAVARVDLGPRLAELKLDQVSWARPFAPTHASPAPASVREVLSVGDVIEVELGPQAGGGPLARLSQPPLVQGSLVAIEPASHRVLALVGGSDFRLSSLVRAAQSVRQPGSAFKPFVYASALQQRLITPATVLMDTPEVYRESLRRSAWKPQNFERVFLGPVTARYALAHSINTVAVKLAYDAGPESIVRLAQALGIHSPLQSNLSLALGSSEVSLLELTNAYAAFADQGRASAPVFITRIQDAAGTELPLEPADSHQVLSPAEAFVLTGMLRAVIEEGTGGRARTLGRPVAGKTGTANEHRDAWFVGYTPDLAAGVWVGFDDHSPLGGWAQGAAAALPSWIEFVGGALRDAPAREFPVPADVLFVRIDPQNGLLAPPGLAEARFEAFIEGTEPRALSARVVEGTLGDEAGPGPLPPPTDRLPKELFQ